MFNNDWINKEIRLLKSDRKYNLNKKEEKVMYFKLIGICLLVIFLASGAYADEYFQCPYCECYSPVTGHVFPDTWKCPNKKCGYENYVGIEKCAMCGTKREK